jgi:hypothetical protein
MLAKRSDGRSLSDTKTSLEKNTPGGETGIGLALARASCRISRFRPHPVSEVCRSDGFLLAFRPGFPHPKNAASLNRRGTSQSPQNAGANAAP